MAEGEQPPVEVEEGAGGASSGGEQPPEPPVEGEEEEQKVEDVTVEGGMAALVNFGLEAPPSHIMSLAATVTSLDLTMNQVSNTAFLGSFTALETLILDNNNIEVLDPSFPSLPKLTRLWINKNNVTDLESLLAVVSGKTPSLQFFSLMGNPACPSAIGGGSEMQYKRYRVRTIYMLGPKNLKFLDAAPVSRDEAEEATSRGEFCKVGKVKQKEALKLQPEQQQPQEFYKNDKAREGNHSSYYGYTKHQYSGKSSEGNRFIVDGNL